MRTNDIIIDVNKSKRFLKGVFEMLKEYMDRQTGEVFDTFAKAYEYAKENYDYGDDTNVITFEELFELVEV